MDRLLREGDPPTGQPASPKPQYKQANSDPPVYEPVEGEHGAAFSKLLNAAGEVVSPATDAKLELIRALLASLDDKEFASEATLGELQDELRLVKTELKAIKEDQTSGNQKFQLSGNIVEKASAQHTEPATTTKTYTRAAGAARIEVYVETGRVRIRTDGQPCTAVTGEPLGEGFGAAWAAPSISVLFVSDAVITVVSR